MIEPPRLPISAALKPGSSLSPSDHFFLPNVMSPISSQPLETSSASLIGGASVTSVPSALLIGFSTAFAWVVTAHEPRSTTPAAPVERPLTAPIIPIASCSPSVEKKFSVGPESGAAACLEPDATIDLNVSSRLSSSSWNSVSQALTHVSCQAERAVARTITLPLSFWISLSRPGVPWWRSKIATIRRSSLAHSACCLSSAAIVSTSRVDRGVVLDHPGDRAVARAALEREHLRVDRIAERGRRPLPPALGVRFRARYGG